MKTLSPSSLDPVYYHDRGNGFADVCLRKNIVHVDATEGDDMSLDHYEADEVQLVTQLTSDEVLAAFDGLWDAAIREQMTPGERMAELETQNVDLQMALCDVYESIGV